jgi:hypothetical protein
MRTSSPSQRMLGSTKVVCVIHLSKVGDAVCRRSLVRTGKLTVVRKVMSIHLFSFSATFVFCLIRSLAVDVFFFLSCLILVVRIAYLLITAVFAC